MNKFFLFISLFFTTSYEVYGQSLTKNNRYSIESSLFLSSSNKLPIWLRSNQFGEVPLESQFLQLSGSVHHEYDSVYNKNKQLNKFSFGYRAKGVINVGKVNQLRLSEAYAKIRFKHFELYAGRRKEIIGLVDSVLSSGSLIWSGNAIPLPKVQLSIPNYTAILGNGLISIKGSFAHGWFGSTDSVQNYFLHQKTFYARIGKSSWKLKFIGGFNHQVQWGGRPTISWYDTKTNQIITEYPSDLKTYINVISGLSLNRKLDAGLLKDGIPYNEAFNRAGNHLGTIDVGFTYDFSKYQIFIYRQSIYEDGSLFYLSNISDGLLGISIYKKMVKGNYMKFNFEYLKTSNQGGNSARGNTIGELRGADNYFNNSLYEDGWTYKNRSIANSFLLPLREYSSLINRPEQYNNNSFLNNRLEAISIGALMVANRISFFARYGLSQNLGSYGYPLAHLIQHSILIKCRTNFQKINYSANFASDFGNFLPESFGFRVSASKTFN